MRAVAIAVAVGLVSCTAEPPEGPLTSNGFLPMGTSGSRDAGVTVVDAGTATSSTPCAVTVPDAGFALSSPCGPDQFCNAPGCQAGVCTPLLTGSISSSFSPECGCDRVTYWNADVAAAAGASIAFDGPCSATVECGGINGNTCPPQATCNLEQFTQSECNIADPVGTCWALPPTCPAVTTNAMSHSCRLNICVDECNLIRQGALWYLDPSCPPQSP